MPQEMSQAGNGFSGAEDTFVPALDGGAESTDTGTENTDQQAGGAESNQNTSGDGQSAQSGEQTEQVGGPKDAKGDRESLMQAFAQEEGLNLDDPRERKIAQRLADKELTIRRFRSDNDRLKTGQGGQASQDEGLTEFERGLRNASTGATGDQTQQGAGQPKDGATSETNTASSVNEEDAGTKWVSPNDAYNDLNAAWTEGNIDKVNAIESAIYARRFEAFAAPLLQQLAELRNQLGSVFPEMSQAINDRRQRDALDFAVSELSRTKGFEGIAELNQEVDGDPVIFNGQEFRNTPMNRILAENPWILSIQEKHADPETAMRLTNLSRYRAAYKIFSGNKLSSGTAQQLVEAGKKIESRTQQDRVRGALNSGSGAGTSLTPDQRKTGSYVQDELLTGMGEPTSFASL